MHCMTSQTALLRDSAYTDMPRLCESGERQRPSGHACSRFCQGFCFDIVVHQRLLRKSKSYGINGNLHGWIQSFLDGRTEAVVVDDETSRSAPAKSGVPQG